MSSSPTPAPLKDQYLCVDFLNTAHQYKNAWVERLATAQQVVAWLIGLGVFTDPADQAMLAEWAREVPDQLVAQLHPLRTDLRQLVGALRTGQALPAPELARLQTVLRSGSRTAQLVPGGTAGWQVQSRLALQHPAHLAVPLAESFAQLLVDGNGLRVKSCSNPVCSVLFYDTTKNQSRTWCDVCATQVKARRYYHKQKAKASAG